MSIGEIKSESKDVSKGVPHGSILGPFLFLIYINDLAKITDIFSLLFADDTSFFDIGKKSGRIGYKP